VLAAAQHHFGLRLAALGGRAMAGDAAALVPTLAGRDGGPGRYDYVLHDVFR
jgi:hypothetical protein